MTGMTTVTPKPQTSSPSSALPPEDSTRIRYLRRLLSTVADRSGPLLSLYQPYVDGLEHLPADGRFLLVGNHTQFSASEILLIPHAVRRTIGKRVRPLADRRMANRNGGTPDLLTAFGAVIGTPEGARELMRANETILVFPGGGREIAKFKGEEYTLRWENRAGFARLAVEHDYPIIPVGLVGGDDVYRSVTTRDGLWGRLSQRFSERATGRSDMALPLARGVGPTVIPRPQRMYLRFAPPIGTTRPRNISTDTWVASIKDRVHDELDATLADLLRIRQTDPYRELAPWAWRSAAKPAAQDRSEPRDT